MQSSIVSDTNRLDDLRREVLSWVQDSSRGGCTKLNRLAEDGCHGTNENRNSSEELHLGKELKKIERGD